MKVENLEYLDEKKTDDSDGDDDQRDDGNGDSDSDSDSQVKYRSLEEKSKTFFGKCVVG